MATLQSFCATPHYVCSNGGCGSRRRSYLPILRSTNSSSTRRVHLPKTSSRVDQELSTSSTTKKVSSNFNTWNNDKQLLAKFLEIAEAAADRAEMHSIIGAQRDNWNHLLTHSMNLITLAAALMAGIASLAPAVRGAVAALKVSSVILFGAATGVMLIVDKIQPSQLAEEQRKATQLFKQLERFMRDTLMLRSPAESDVEDAMEKVLVLDKAYPLPLLPVMLEKFPENVEPTCWWPKWSSCSWIHLDRLRTSWCSSSIPCSGRRHPGNCCEHLATFRTTRNAVRVVSQLCRLLRATPGRDSVQLGGGGSRGEGEWRVVQDEGGSAAWKEPI